MPRKRPLKQLRRVLELLKKSERAHWHDHDRTVGHWINTVLYAQCSTLRSLDVQPYHLRDNSIYRHFLYHLTRHVIMSWIYGLY